MSKFIKKIIKELFCKHEYINEVVYSLSGKHQKVVCKKCGKVKQYILLEQNNMLSIKEHALNKGWYIE